MKPAPLDLSIVIPVFNEALQIEHTLREVVSAMDATPCTYEILVVDDGSEDETVRVVRDLAATAQAAIQLIQHPYNKGNGAAVRTGIQRASGKLVACLDGDGQHDPAYIPAMLAFFPAYDLVVGARDHRYEGVWYRNAANRFYNVFASWLTEIEVKDLTSGFRVFRREAIYPFLNLFPQGFSYPTTSTMLMLKAGYNVRFFPVQTASRRSGESKIRPWRDGQQFLMIMLKVIMLYDPLRIFSPVSVGMIILGLLSTLSGIVTQGRLYIPNSATFFFISAVLIVLMGLVSSQIANLILLFNHNNQ